MVEHPIRKTDMKMREPTKPQVNQQNIEMERYQPSKNIKKVPNEKIPFVRCRSYKIKNLFQVLVYFNNRKVKPLFR
jgi:hypothetical protein